MWIYLNSLSEEEVENLLSKPLDVYFKPIDEQAELDLSKMDLDQMCTNFQHS